MQTDLTDIAILLDSSGSMQSIRDDTIGGFNLFLEEQKKQPGQAVLTLVTFNTDYNRIHSAVPLEDVKPLTTETYWPQKNTALLDALGRLINETGERLKNTPEDRRPFKVIFVVITDGQENSSHEFNRKRVSEMVTHQHDVYKWEFVFLGSNQDSFAEAGTLGVKMVNTVNYAATGAGVKCVFSAASRGMSAYRGAGGQSVAANGFFEGAKTAEQYADPGPKSKAKPGEAVKKGDVQ
jgi:uncharacterized protein YegL